MAKLTKDEETQLLKASVHKYIMSEEEFNVVEKILSSSHMDQGFDVIQIDNNDMFKDFEEDRVVPLQTGLSWMWEGLVEPTIDELTQDEKKTLSELLNKFDVLHGKKLNENLEIISSENTLFADSYTNEILNKIRTAGIEVVTDKDEFDRILNTEQSIQRMTGNIEKLKELQKSLDDKKLQEKEIELAEQAQLQSEKELQEKYFKKFVNTAKEYQDYIPVGKLEKFSWVYYNSESKQLISDSKMRTENSKGHVAMMNVCLFKDISGDLHLGVYEDDSNFIEDISSIYNLTKEKISTPAGQTNARTDRGLTDLNIYLDTFKKFALENDIANTFPSKIISRYETEIKSLETKNTVRINSLEKSQDNYNSYENRISGKSSESNVFNYKGYTFLPVRYFKPGDEYKTVKENLTWTDAIIRIPHTGSDFSINDFFAAADKNGNADIFYCVEKGKFFTLSEEGIHSLNDGTRNKENYDAELEEFRTNNTELLSKLNRFSFNEEKDTLLMTNIAEVLELGEVFEKENETLGNVRIRKGTGINANGILHIAERRLEKKILHEHMDVQKAIEETSAILFCAINNIDKKPAVKETNGRWAVYDNGIKTAIDKDKKGYFVVTGFDLDETNQEAAETINAVNARYGYKPEFHEIYAQVGAAYASLMERLTQQKPDVNEQFSSTIQKMIAAENTYGFVHEGIIYLNPDYLSSNAAVHEYTHLWDAYTQKTNPELWSKGLEIFKDTKYWNEVISDPNYQDIKDDENLVLSEIHSRICGDIAEKVLERIAEFDGEQVKLDAIDWNKETWEYIAFELNVIVGTDIAKDVHDFLSTPMKDIIASKNINISKIHELNENKEERTMKNSENNTQNNNVNDPMNVFEAYNLPKELDDSYSHSEFTKALREAIETQLPNYSDDKNADNYAVSALLNPIMVGYANTGDEKLYKAAKETVVQYLEKYITYEYTETEELMQMKAEGTLDDVAEKELRERIEYDSRSIVDNYITSSEFRPEEQLKYSNADTLKNFRKLDWRSDFFESSTYKDTKDYKTLLKDYNHFNYIRRFSDEVSKEINEREKLSSLSPEELEQKIERALQDGNAIYVNGKETPDRYHYGLRITPNKGKYSMYGYVIGQSNPAKRIEKLKEYKISNEIREGIKNKNVLEVLSKHGLSVHSIEDSRHQDLRLFNDKIDKFIKEDLITSFKDGFYSKDKVESLTSKLTNSSLPENLTYRDLYNELSKDKCYRLDEKGPELFNLLKTDDKEIIDEIKGRMNDIWRGGGNLYLRIPHAHPDYGERPYWNEAFDYAEEKVYKFELDEKDRKVTVDGKEYYNEEGVIYSTTLFDNDCFFNAKELDTGDEVAFYMDRNTKLGPLSDGAVNGTVGRVIVESPESGFVATDIYQNRDSDGKPYRNEHLDNRISDCLKLGRFLTEREFHKERAEYIKELSSKSVFLESEIPDLHHYYPEEQKEEAQKKYDENKAKMLQELEHKGVQLPCIMFGYKEGWQDSVPELITNKIYSVKEFEQIIGETDINHHEKYLGYDKSDVYIIDKDGDVHYERFDIGDGDGGLIARFQHQYDYQMNQGYEKYWNKEKITEEQWKEFRQADLELINMLKEAVENDVNRHLNLRENNAERGTNSTPVWDAERYVFNNLKSQTDVLSLPEEYKDIYLRYFKELTKEDLYAGNELLMQKIPQIVEVVQLKGGRKGIIKQYPNGFGFSEVLPDNFKNPILEHVDDYSETLDGAEKKLLDYLGGHNIDGLTFNQQMIEENLYNDVIAKAGLDEIAVFLKDVRWLNDSFGTNTTPSGQEELINYINEKWGSNFKLKDETFAKDITTLNRWANELL